MTPLPLAEAVRSGDRRALARLLTFIENDSPAANRALETLLPFIGNAHLIGITGPPGGGKSSLVNELIRAYRFGNHRIAVIAVDPSSPLTGGATLGDRIRMGEWHNDPAVFIRSMASRRFGGGLSRNTLAIAHAFDAAGYDPILIETVGTGQDEVAIASLAMTTIVVQVPGTGDSVQSIKAGALEIADILVVTKGDRPEAADLSRDLRAIASIARSAGAAPHSWEPPVITTSAVTRAGIDGLVQQIAAHRDHLRQTGAIHDRLRQIAVAEVVTRVSALLAAELDRADGPAVQAWLRRLQAHEATPQRIAEEIMAQLGLPPNV